MSETRRRILARRAGFIATALAAALPDAGCKKEKPPEEDVAEPQACLKVDTSKEGKGKGKMQDPPQPDAGVADGTAPDAKPAPK